jgi:signal transduction histidine kinase/DNA-binding response OmpR family regulator
MELNKEIVDSTRINILHKFFLQYQKDSLSVAEETILHAITLSQKTDQKRLLAVGYNLYGDFLRIQSREDSAIAVLNKSLEIARNQGFQKEQSDALISMGNSYWQKGDFEMATKLHVTNIELTKTTNDLGHMASSYLGLGAINSQQGEYTKAMEYYTSAGEIFLELGQERNYAVTLGNIGYIQRSLENYDNAIDYFHKCERIHTRLKDMSGKAFATYNLSVAYRHKGMLDSAMTCVLSAIDLYTRLGIKKRVSFGYFSKAEIHRKKEAYSEALMDYQKSLDLSAAVDDSVQIGYSSMAVADMYDELGDEKKSIEYLNNAAMVAERMKLDILSMDVHERLAKRLASQGNMGTAYKNLEHFVQLRDSLYTREKRELGSEIEARYQNEQKAREIALLASGKELQALQLKKRVNERNVIIAFALLAILVAGLLYNQYRIKQKSNKELKELDRLKSNFFANISHEFRTPLTLIKGPIEQLEQNPDEPLSRENAKMIRRNANRVLGLVDQLLELSQIDQGKMKLKPTEGDIYKCFRAAAFSFDSHAAQRNMDFKVDIPGGVLWAAFDRDKLEKIIYNLLSNAFKFSDDDETVSFKVGHNFEELIIQVGDSGKGIPEDRLPYIFDRFYQVDSSNTKEKEGSGIGLSLSKDLVELMDGTITVASEEGKGTFFTVQLPVQKIETREKIPHEKQRDARQGTVKPPSYQLDKPDKRNLPEILLVEDNADMRQFIREHLIKEYKVKEALNGVEGFEKANSDVPHLIVSDLMMPKMDGIELCKKLKTNLPTSHIPVIMLTARAGMDNKIEGLESGADDYLTKPFHANELLARVKNLVEQRKKLRELFGKKDVSLDPEKVTATPMDQKFLEQMLELLEKKHPDPEYSVSQMQTDLAMSKTQLHRKIKALTNETPGELLKNFRLKRAAQLLSKKVDTVTQIAYRTGFKNPSYFAKCFKEMYGLSPSSF